MDVKIEVDHEGFVYGVENQGNEIIMYKNDIDEWMGDIEYIKVFTIEGDTPSPVALYRKLAKATQEIVASSRESWYMFNVADEKRANIYERVGKSIKGYSCQRADKYFYLYKE
tara:strand:+ start:1162 stop:1500 length:339 start_codon:yes stop_codon:yes gene_type:complete